MFQSITGQRYFERVGESLARSHCGRFSETPTHVAVLHAEEQHRRSSGTEQLIGGLWYQLSLGRRFLAEENWTEDEQWEVALGVFPPLPNPTHEAPSIARALADLALVVATRKVASLAPLPREHRHLILAAIGVVDRLSWEHGKPTARGREIDIASRREFPSLNHSRTG